MRRRGLILGMAGGVAMARAGLARAAPNRPVAREVVVGAIYPLTGLGAAAGLAARTAVEVAAEIVNTRHAPIPIRLGAGGGLPGLGGAVIGLAMGDSRDDPAQARAEAERLILQEDVAALVGGLSAESTAAIAEVAARHGRPFVTAGPAPRPGPERPGPERPGPERPGWSFHVGPQAAMYGAALFACLRDIGARSGRPAHTVALFHEDSQSGQAIGAMQKRLAAAAGLEVRADVRYRPSSPALASEALLLKAADADVLLPSSNTADALGILGAMAALKYRPRGILAQSALARSAGFRDPSFLAAAGARAEGVMSQAGYAPDAVAQRPGIAAVEALFRARGGAGLDDASAGAATALLVLADAFDRAGEARPEAARAALAATDIPGGETIMPWRGVRFDGEGRNIRGRPVVQQVSGGAWRTVWPFELASAPAVWTPRG